MLDGVHRLSGLPELRAIDGGGTVVPKQEVINALPSIMGPVADPDNDSTARVDRAGYVYLWEPDGGVGFWVQAGYVRNGRPRFGQVIDPDDIQWFNLGLFKKKLAQAKKSLNSVQLSSDADTWDVTAKDERREDRASHRPDDDDVPGMTYRAPEDSDLDIV